MFKENGYIGLSLTNCLKYTLQIFCTKHCLRRISDIVLDLSLETSKREPIMGKVVLVTIKPMKTLLFVILLNFNNFHEFKMSLYAWYTCPFQVYSYIILEVFFSLTNNIACNSLCRNNFET